MIADTPAAPYYAVIFTSVRTEGDVGYAEAAARMLNWPVSSRGFSGWNRLGAKMGWE